MRTKDSSVNIWGLEVEMQPVVKAANIIWKKFGQELVVTSARDGMHSAGSLHYYGYAVDLRIWGLEDRLKDVVKNLRDVLTDDYQVITHKTHVHVEYQKALSDLR